MAPFRTKAPLPTNLTVTLTRVPSRPDGGFGGPPDRWAASRPHFAILLKRGGREVGPFYWTGAVDQKHAKAMQDHLDGVRFFPAGQPRGDLTPEEAMHALASDACCYLDSGPDLDGFAREFGDPSGPISETLRAFEACRKVWETFALLGLDPHAPCFQEA